MTTEGALNRMQYDMVHVWHIPNESHSINPACMRFYIEFFINGISKEP